MHEVRQTRLHREWLLTVAIAMLLLVFFIFNRAAQPIGNVVYDHFLRWQGFEHAQDIVIISVDDRSLQELGNWPLKRSNYQLLTDQLQDKRYRPKALGIDLLFFDATKDDAALAHSIRRLPAVLPLEFKLQTDSKQTYKPMPPIAPLGEAARLGHINLNFDSDGTIRSFKSKDENWMHFALSMHALGVPSANVNDLNGTYRFQMVDPAVGFPTISLVDAIRSDHLKTLLKDKYVLIGVTSTSLGDRHPTLYSGETNSSTPGVAILASILNASLNNTLITDLTPIQLFVAEAIGMLILLRGFIFLKPRASLILAVLFILTLATFSYLLLSHASIWFDPTPCIIVTALIQPIWTWRRLEAIFAVVEEKTAILQTLGPQRSLNITSESKSREVVLQYGKLLDLAVSSVRSELDFLSTVIDELPNAIIIFDSYDSLLLSNRHAKKLFNSDLFPTGATLDSVAETLTVPVHVLNDIGLKREAENKTITFTLQTAGGLLDFYIKSVLVVSPHGSTMRLVILTDVSELTQSKTQRDRALQFLSHDMRTPVAAILSIIQQADIPKSLSEKISHHSNALLQMMDDFILHISSEAPEYTFKEELLDNLLNDAIERVADLAKPKNIRIIDQSEPTLVFVMTNTRLMVRALVNLLFNAIKFAPRDSSIFISTEYQITGEKVTIRISNSVQDADNAQDLTPSMPGFGLGLDFADTVIHKHHGQLVRHIPEKNGMALITISLPCSTHI